MTKLTWPAALVAAGVFGSFAAASAQQTAAAPDGEIAAQLQRIVADAASRGLPTAPIVAKAARGVMMKVPTARVIAAAQAVAARLDQARTVLAPSPIDADIMAGEDALSFGVSTTALKQVRAVSPRRSVAVPVGVLAQLVANHVSQQRATNIVIDLMRRGASSEQLVALGNDVNGDIALGGSPDNALDIRVRGLVPLLGPAANAGSNSSNLGATAAEPSGPKKP
jgi:hypothetical protein